MFLLCNYAWASHHDFHSLIEDNITWGKYVQVNANKEKVGLGSFQTTTIFFFPSLEEVTATSNTELSCFGT